MRRYGNNRQMAEDATRCITEVWPDGWHPHQCSRKRGHGRDGRYCKQHAAMLARLAARRKEPTP